MADEIKEFREGSEIDFPLKGDYRGQKKHPKKAAQNQKDTNRRYFLKRKYGITPEQYAELLLEQKGVCAICGGMNKKNRRLFVDHNHQTNQVRGLLCRKCNSIIAYANEDLNILREASNYLIRYNSIKKMA